LGRIPVDPFQLARANGLKVIHTRFTDDSIAGALYKKPGRRPEILLRALDGEARRRFTCAHELGHFTWNGDDEGEYERVDRRDTLSTEGAWVEEVYANTFAAAVLMPEQHIRAMHEEGLFDWEMAKRFGVSKQAVAYRRRGLALTLQGP
jgi:Zn-dependent peptidase ImmA (M78 family)